MPYNITLLSRILYNQIIYISSDPPTSKTTITIKCNCGNETKLNFRSFWRKWYDKEQYYCKSCHVKTYIASPERALKFQESFSKTAQNDEYKKKCSENGKKAWSDLTTRQRIIESVRADNKTNPKKKKAREIALAALKAKPWFKKHMVEMRANQLKSGKSILESVVAKILDELQIEYTQQFNIGYYLYDIKINNVLIEIQGEYWHQNTLQQDSAKATYAINAGYKIHHLWEYEFASINKVRDKILLWLGMNNQKQIEFEFSKITIQQVQTKEARVFLGAYHYLPAISKTGWHIGAFLDGQLIAVCTFSSPVRKQSITRLQLTLKQVKELSRFCIHPLYHKKNFASWFLTKAVKEFKRNFKEVKQLIAFADETFGHNGTIYKASNWLYDGTTKPSYCYISSDGYLAHKKTIWDRACKLGISEGEYINRSNYKRVETKSKHRYLLRLR